jgi:hypothetical protein
VQPHVLHQRRRPDVLGGGARDGVAQERQLLHPCRVGDAHPERALLQPRRPRALRDALADDVDPAGDQAMLAHRLRRAVLAQHLIDERSGRPRQRLVAIGRPPALART